MSASTMSISKGVFVYRNGFKASSKRSKKKDKNFDPSANGVFSNQQWCQIYHKLWKATSKKIKNANNEMFSSVLSDLVAFLKTSYKNLVSEIPTATLLTGINMPDHAAQFKVLAKEIKNQVTPHVATLYSEDCQNLKCLIENMVDQFVNNTCPLSDDENSDDDTKPKLRKTLCNMSLLQSWYESLYSTKITTENSPRKMKTRKSSPKILVAIIQDFECFNDKAVQDFLLIISSYINVLPIVLVFGVATSLSAIHRTFPYHISSKINVKVFNSQSSSSHLNNIIEKVVFSEECPFQLGGKIFNLFTDIFLFYNLSVEGFVQNYKYAMMEHFSYGNAMTLCSTNKNLKNLMDCLKHDDLESVRKLMSFRPYVENKPPEERIKLLTDDDFLKEILQKELPNLFQEIRVFHLFLRCLHVLVRDLPKSPLGKQVRELYSVAISKDITSTQEYKDCLQLLQFQSKEELNCKLENICDTIEDVIKESKVIKFSILKENLDEIYDFIDDLEETEMEVDKIPEKEEIKDAKLNRQQLKEQLLKMATSSKPLNKYEKDRAKILDYFSKLFEKYLGNPSTKPFHEIFFFNDLSIKPHIIGSHRAAIHAALNDPHSYLQCSCCEVTDDSAILNTMPDICVVYKLHLECGKLINIYDWLQSFVSIVEPESDAEDEEQGKRKLNPEIQARFTQAVADLEYLGFIKTSKRKADHVTRLTWGG